MEKVTNPAGAKPPPFPFAYKKVLFLCAFKIIHKARGLCHLGVSSYNATSFGSSGV